MRYLVGIPCLYGPGHTKEAIESVVNYPDVDVLLIDNGAEHAVKDLINSYSQRDNVNIISNNENIYVNPAWNQILEFFLINRNIYDYLLIMNSDLVLYPNWDKILSHYLNVFPDIIPVPVIGLSKDILRKEIDYGFSFTEVFEGTPGVLIILNKDHANHVYPIPETIKVWFGDNWIYEGLRKLGFKTMVLNNLFSYHSGSQNVSKVKGISEIIEQDKIEWEKLK